jgi:hypothetical protein
MKDFGNESLDVLFSVEVIAPISLFADFVELQV